MPYTVSKADYKQRSLMGNYTAVLLADSKADLPKIEAEYASVVSKIKPDNKDFDVFISSAENYLASFLSNTPLGDADSNKRKANVYCKHFCVAVYAIANTKPDKHQHQQDNGTFFRNRSA